MILGFGLDLQIGGSLRSRKHLDNFILPLGGVVSYWLHKVHLSTCSSFPVGVGTSDSLRWNFLRRRKFRPKLSSLPTVADM